MQSSCCGCQNPMSKCTCQMREPIVLVHGGAGVIPDGRVKAKLVGARRAANIGYAILKNGGSSVDAVEAAVECFENDEAFNCGYGSVLNENGEVEMDACVMDGNTLKSGAVTAIKDVAHPVAVARLVMERSPHHLFCSTGANCFAMRQGICVMPPNSLVTEAARSSLRQFLEQRKMHPMADVVGGETGTVGAVAVDRQGHLAAATSTGGLTGKMAGRCSDSSAVGGGTYADDMGCAASATGHGETIARYCLTHAISMEIKKGTHAQEAARKCLEEMTNRLKNTAGVICLTKCGQVGIGFNTERMGWAYRIKDEMHFGIEPNEHRIEPAVVNSCTRPAKC